LCVRVFVLPVAC